MTSDDSNPSEFGPDEADTASFQEFMDADDTSAVDDGRTFRLLSLLVGIAVLVAVMYLLLF